MSGIPGHRPVLVNIHGGKVWYLMARDAGHGFQSKRNADFHFLSTILFLREHLLN